MDGHCPGSVGIWTFSRFDIPCRSTYTLGGVTGGYTAKTVSTADRDDFLLPLIAIESYTLPSEVRRCPTFSSNAGHAGTISLPMKQGLD